jgi:tyrosine-protein phosphatase SIW14
MTRLPFSRSLRMVIVVASLCAMAVPTVCAQTMSADSVHSQSTPLVTSAPAERLKLTGVPNAGKISDVLLRGAQPEERGFLQLKNLGVTTIVNLRGPGRAVEWERKVAQSLGLRYVNIPVSGWSPPSDAQVAQFLKLFHDSAGQRVFVHCYYGDDRTGVIVAAYRIAQQNWTAKQAVNEMYSFGFHHHLYPNMESYVSKFPASLASESIFSFLRAVPTPAAEGKQP